MAKPTPDELDWVASVWKGKLRGTIAQLEKAASILLRCSLSGECRAAYKHVYVIKQLGHRLDAMRYYKKQGKKVDIPLGDFDPKSTPSSSSNEPN